MKWAAWPQGTGDVRACDVCGGTRPCRWCGACKAWICEPCSKSIPARAVAAYMRLKERLKHKTLWQEVFGR